MYTVLLVHVLNVVVCWFPLIYFHYVRYAMQEVDIMFLSIFVVLKMVVWFSRVENSNVLA